MGYKSDGTKTSPHHSHFDQITMSALEESQVVSSSSNGNTNESSSSNRSNSISSNRSNSISSNRSNSVSSSSDRKSKAKGPWTNAIISKEEIQRFIDLGLGRGIDTTDPELWRNKCAFTVRHATFKNVIGTDEGNLAEDYSKKVLSGNDLQEEFKESVIKSATTPIPIVLEAGSSRSAVSTRIVKGKRVVTRTVSFDYSKSISDDKNTFEDVISKWIKKHENMEKGCEEFIQYFGVTHYVTSITLGASEHSIFTEEEHAEEIQKKKSKSKLKRKLKEVKDAVMQLTTSETVTSDAATETKETKCNHSRVRKLGVMNENKVERGTTDEAVIGIKILPIHSLIEKNQTLRETLRQALITYTTKNRGYASSKFLFNVFSSELTHNISSQCSWPIHCGV